MKPSCGLFNKLGHDTRVLSWRTSRVSTHKEPDARVQAHAGIPDQGRLIVAFRKRPKARLRTARTAEPNFSFDDDSGARFWKLRALCLPLVSREMFRSY